jgi:hypothetical protein
MKSRRKRIKQSKIQFAMEENSSSTFAAASAATTVTTTILSPDKDLKPNTGALTLPERQKVDDAVTSFLELHQISREDLGTILHPRTTKALATIFSAKPIRNQKEFRNFPSKIKEISGVNRTPHQIYWYMKRAYSEFRQEPARIKRDRIKWTKDEDKELKRMITIKGIGNWVSMERAMGKIGAKDRYDCLCSARNGTWTQEEEV